MTAIGKESPIAIPRAPWWNDPTICRNMVWKNGVHTFDPVPKSCRIHAKAHWSCFAACDDPKAK